MMKVDSCPSNEDEKNKLARDKNCRRYWNLYKHECNEDPLKFQYHCVINDYKNETIEVCGIKTIIKGYCTEFNVKGGSIQAHFGYDCTKFDPPCKSNYSSTEAYLYKPCYNFSGKQNKVDGGWSTWSPFGSWSDCTVTCGGGVQQSLRTRECKNPEPENGVRECEGSEEDKKEKTCNSQPCPGTSLRLELWATKLSQHVSTMNSSKSSKRTLFYTGVQNEVTKGRYIEHESTNKFYLFTSIISTRFSSERPAVLVKSDVFWSGYIPYVIFGLAGLFVIFFGIFAFSFMHKNVFQRRNLELPLDTFQKENTDYMPIQRNVHIRSSIIHTNEQETLLAFIPPMSENDIQYEEITMLNSSVDGSSLEDNEMSCESQDDKNKYLDPNTYLTPIAETYLTPVADSENTYVEVVD
ncbi:uncharacterized protein LOC134260184 [Saccostrea cucullata]|uniref:uncharacterized protein LOC134260184 n=1 Tax=Saccostrea cuccullata TaxID=36930 RepID=UPI002ED03F49